MYLYKSSDLFAYRGPRKASPHSHRLHGTIAPVAPWSVVTTA